MASCVSDEPPVFLASPESVQNGRSHADNAAGFAIHGALHMARPDLNAAAHAHSLYGKAFAAMGRNLDIASDGESSRDMSDTDSVPPLFTFIPHFGRLSCLPPWRTTPSICWSP